MANRTINVFSLFSAISLFIVPLSFCGEPRENERVRRLDVESLPKFSSVSEWAEAVQWEGFELINTSESQGFWFAFFRSPHDSLAIAIKDTNEYENNDSPTLSWSVHHADGEGAVDMDSATLLPRYYLTKFSINQKLVSGKRLDFVDEHLKKPVPEQLRVRISASSPETSVVLFNDLLKFSAELSDGSEQFAAPNP